MYSNADALSSLQPIYQIDSNSITRSVQYKVLAAQPYTWGSWATNFCYGISFVVPPVWPAPTLSNSY